MIVVAGQGQLLHLVDAFRPAGGFASGLDGGEEQGDEHANDGDHDQQFDERETTPERLLHVLDSWRTDTTDPRMIAR